MSLVEFAPADKKRFVTALVDYGLDPHTPESVTHFWREFWRYWSANLNFNILVDDFPADAKNLEEAEKQGDMAIYVPREFMRPSDPYRRGGRKIWPTTNYALGIALGLTNPAIPNNIIVDPIKPWNNYEPPTDAEARKVYNNVYNSMDYYFHLTGQENVLSDLGKTRTGLNKGATFIKKILPQIPNTGWRYTENILIPPYLGTNRHQLAEALIAKNRDGMTINEYLVASLASFFINGRFFDEDGYWTRLLGTKKLPSGRFEHETTQTTDEPVLVSWLQGNLRLDNTRVESFDFRKPEQLMDVSQNFDRTDPFVGGRSSRAVLAA